MPPRSLLLGAALLATVVFRFTPARAAERAPAPAAESFAVVALGDAPAGPPPWVTEAAYAVRAALRDRAFEVLGAPELSTRLLAERPPGSYAEYDRMFDQGQAAFDEGEFEVSARLLRGTADALERLPDAPPAYDRWLRASFQRVYALRAAHQLDDAASALERIVAADPRVAADPFLYPPSLLRQLEEVRARVEPQRTARLTLMAFGGASSATAFVNGRAVGALPATLALPPGRYRVSGVSGEVRLPALTVDVPPAGRTMELDFALAAAYRPSGGPGLALEAAARRPAMARLGRMTAVGNVVTLAALDEGGGPQLQVTVLEGRSGATLREVRLRPERTLTAVQAGAVAAYLLSGAAGPGLTPVSLPDGLAPGERLQPHRGGGDELDPIRALAALDLRDPDPVALVLRGAGRTPARDNPLAPVPHTAWELASARRWRTASLATGGAAAVLLGVTAWQVLAAHGRYADADAMLLGDGTFKPGVDPAAYARALGDGDAAKRNALVGAVGTVALAAASFWCGHVSADRGVPVLEF